MNFYHVSPWKISAGERLNQGRREYVCLAVSVRQALYWASALYESGREIDGKSFSLSDVFLYEVFVDDNGIVEDCPGHYAFEYQGVMKRAVEVRLEPHEADLDGEVVCRSPVKVIGKVDNIDVPAEARKLQMELQKELWQEL